MLKHLPLIWREFGAVCVLKCLRVMVTGEQKTFLEVACCKEHQQATKKKSSFRN